MRPNTNSANSSTGTRGPCGAYASCQVCSFRQLLQNKPTDSLWVGVNPVVQSTRSHLPATLEMPAATNQPRIKPESMNSQNMWWTSGSKTFVPLTAE